MSAEKDQLLIISPTEQGTEFKGLNPTYHYTEMIPKSILYTLPNLYNHVQGCICEKEEGGR